MQSSGLGQISGWLPGARLLGWWRPGAGGDRQALALHAGTATNALRVCAGI